MPVALGEALGGLTISLSALILWLVAAGLAVFWFYTLGPVFRHLASVGIPTGVLGTIHPLGFLKTVDHDVMQWLNDAQKYGERGMIWGFSTFAQIFELVAGAVGLLGVAIWDLGEWTTSYVQKALHAHALTRVYPTVTKVVRTTVRVTSQAIPKLEARVHALEREVGARVHAAAGAIAVPLPRIGQLERDVTGAKKELGKLKWLIGTGSILALGTAILSKLGLNWLRCRNTKNFNQKVCATNPRFWDDLFAGAILLSGTFSFVEFVKEAQAGFDLGIEGLSLIVRELKDLEQQKG